MRKEEEAIEYIKEILNIANSKGIFTLKEASLINESLDILEDIVKEYNDQLEITKDLVEFSNGGKGSMVKGYISKNIAEEMPQVNTLKPEQIDNIII